MPYTYTLTARIPAAPAEVYDAWLDSLGHSEMTGAEATVSDEVGAEFSAWDGYISGRNLELVPGERIVQAWRTTEFDEGDADSILTVVLQVSEEGTLLTLEHSNVPDTHRSYEESGWQSHYFEPMIAYFSAPVAEEEPEPAAAAESPRPPAHELAPRRAAKRAVTTNPRKKRASKPAPKRARAASVKARPAPRTKPAAKKRTATSKGKARAAPPRSRAKSPARKTSRRKRR